MKLVRNAKTLKGKALSSLRIGLEAFNSFSDNGRQTTVLLHLQHACEMLLKAALTQKRVDFHDKNKGHAHGFKKCLNLAIEHCKFNSSQAGTFRAIDAMRDGEQHWLITVPEDTLYLHARSLITAIDEILENVFTERLGDHLPQRVLPVSTMPEANFDVMVDRECKLIKNLLAPGRRARDEAQGRIRTLLSMRGHVTENAEISEKDVVQIEKAIKSGKDWKEVFPQLTNISTQVVGTSVDVKVHFTKKQGIPVKFVSANEQVDAAAVREINLQEKFRYSRKEIAERLGLNIKKAKLLRDILAIDDDKRFCREFVFQSQHHLGFSDQALSRMKEALKEQSIIDKISAPISRKKI